MMGAVLTRWMVGEAASPAAPLWSAELGADPNEAELRLLAMSGQFLGVALTAEPPDGLRALPDIPLLALPTLPDALRSLSRRILAAVKDARTRGDLLHFLAARGWTMHPGDWMPAASDDEAPDVYAPWRDWAEAAASASVAPGQAGDALTDATWADFWPAMRKVALADLRRRTPDAARALMQGKFATCHAEERLRLLALLATGLSEADRDFLESIVATDRAPKVKALAVSLLSRLGHGPAVGENATELAGFFESRTKGLLRRTKVIAPLPVKIVAQSARRRQLFGDLEIATFAAALGVAPDDLVAMWTWGQDQQADVDFVGMAARSGSDRLVAALAAALHNEALHGVQVAVLLRPRLTATQRAAFATRVLAGGESFANALWIAGGIGQLDGAIGTRAGAALLAALAAEGANPAPQAVELQALGLIASHSAAVQALSEISRAGCSAQIRAWTCCASTLPWTTR